MCIIILFCFFFFNDTTPTEIYTLSLHDALPIWGRRLLYRVASERFVDVVLLAWSRSTAHADDHSWRMFTALPAQDRKSTRLNSSHPSISYAVFCLKKKRKKNFNLCTVTYSMLMI